MAEMTSTNVTDWIDEEAPTGWLVLASKQSVVKMIDALLSMPPHREFNKTELAEFADISRKSVHTHLPLLLELEIITGVPNSSPQRYRFDTDNEIAEQLIRLDGAVNNAGPFAGEA
jgi:hypothetical protein